jgi:hypothetical protein
MNQIYALDHTDYRNFLLSMEHNAMLPYYVYTNQPPETVHTQYTSASHCTIPYVVALVLKTISILDLIPNLKTRMTLCQCNTDTTLDSLVPIIYRKKFEK